MFSLESQEEIDPLSRESLRNSAGKKSIICLTRDLTAVELEPQRNAVLPCLRFDPHEAGQDRLWDSIEDHLRGVGVGVENLQTERNI